jgi:aspartyl-tRNA(Asn)/glutamyl-tRNA(Gln) amidotransferase subunit A
MIRKLHQQLVDKTLTAEELAKQYLSRIEEKEPSILAYLSLFDKEEILAQAKLVDEKIARGETIGILEGIPGALKDNILLAGKRATGGSKILENYIAPHDATVVTRLKESGALFLGKTNMDEFAMGSSTENSAYQITKNPHDISRVPGGSSGGSAAAVASDMAVWALGSDTGGSIRQPAAFCGLVGLKPTYGRVSRSGLMAMASSLDQIGTFTHTVEDAAILLSCIAGQDEMDATTAPTFQNRNFPNELNEDIRGMKIGIPEEYMSENIDPSIKLALENAQKNLQALGAELVPVSLPHTKLALAVYYVLMPAEVSSNIARLDGIRYGTTHTNEAGEKSGDSLLDTYLKNREHGLGQEVKRRVMLGTYVLSSGYYDAYYGKSEKVRALIKKDFEEAFKTVDVLFTPTTPEVAFPIGEKTTDPLTMYLSDIFTVTANLAGIPALSLPIGDKEGLPIGGQFLAKWFDEEGLLRVAHALEQKQLTDKGL